MVHVLMDSRHNQSLPTKRQKASLLQSVVPNDTQTPGEIEMDLNGDGIVDEFESQNQPPVPGEQYTLTVHKLREKLKWT